MRRAIVFLGVVLLPVTAAAQSVAHSFAELNRQQVLKEGDAIFITYIPSGEAEYLEGQAKVVGLTESAITMTLEGSEIEIPEGRVKRIERRRKDSILNGVLFGAGAGGLA